MNAISLPFRPMCKAGPLHNGAERGKGTIIHAVPSGHATHGDCGPALCGQQPAIMWSPCDGSEVTCPRCRRLLDTTQKPAAASPDAPVVYLDLDSLDLNKRPSGFRNAFSAWEAPR
jgi:hypothetical protein